MENKFAVGSVWKTKGGYKAVVIEHFEFGKGLLSRKKIAWKEGEFDDE